MRLEFLVDWAMNELDIKFLVDIIIGTVMLLFGLFFDFLVGIHVSHSPRFGIGQIVWCFFWGMYILWTWYYQRIYGK